MTILAEMPEEVEQIATVKALSASGWNQQEKFDYVVEELKQQAAKVGANAVVLTGRDTVRSNTLNISSLRRQSVSISETEIVAGVAVYIK